MPSHAFINSWPRVIDLVAMQYSWPRNIFPISVTGGSVEAQDTKQFKNLRISSNHSFMAIVFLGRPICKTDDADTQ